MVAEAFSATARPPRLIMTVMYLDNFKSYAGVQRVGPFHKCFSSVVGPNGSGKSNVIDGLLFVFGKRAKQLRLNKVSELIHNSTNYRDLDYARVSIHFQDIIDLDDEEYELVPGTELVITRTAYKNNTSKYFLNDRASSFTEVTNVLKGKGVDLDNNRFLILQGEVEQISMMKPKGQGPNDEGLLEYLEDIIGSNRFIAQIEEGAKKLETLNEERVGKVQRVKLVEKEKENLEGTKLEAESYIKKEMELLRCKVQVLQLSLLETSRAAEQHAKKKADMEATLAEEKAKRSEDEKKLKEMEAVHSKHRREHEVIQKELAECEKGFKEFERKDIKCREDIKHRKQKVKKLDEKMSKDAKKAVEMEKQTSEAEALIPELEARVVDITAKLAEQEKVLERIQEAISVEVAGYRVELQGVRKELAPWEKKLAEAKADLDVAQSERDLLVNKHAAAQKTFEDAKKTTSTSEGAIKKNEVELAVMAAALEQHKVEVQLCRAEEKACQAGEETLAARVQAARGRVAELQGAKSAESNRGKVLRALLQEKASGRLPGVYGRLGDLGAIDAKYNVAISTAAGALDYILVDNAATAQACMDFLRKGNLGVTTCLMLENQRHLIGVMKQPVQTPEGVPRLFDLVRVRDESVLPAFYFALRDTVVAKDLDQGSRIAYGADRRFRRVVTLEGQLFEASGTMSGGGARPVGNKMGTTVAGGGVSEKELADAEAELKRLSSELDALRAKGGAAGAVADRAEKAVQKLEVQIPKARLEVQALEKQAADLAKQLGDLERAAQPSKEELARLAELVAAIKKGTKVLEGLEASSADLKKKAEQLQEQLDNAGGERLKEQKARVEQLQKDIDEAGTNINKNRVLISSHQKALPKLHKAQADSAKEKEKLVLEVEMGMAELKQLEKEAFVVSENFQKAQELEAQKAIELDSIHKEYVKCKTAVETLTGREVDIQLQLEDCAKSGKEIERQAKVLEKKAADISKEQEQYLVPLELPEADAAALKAAMEPEDSRREPLTRQELEERVTLLAAQVKEMKPNISAITEYRKKEAEYNERVGDLEVITEERDRVRKEHDELRKNRLDEFMAGFNAITMKLKEMYQMITMGGDAELELVDSLDPFSEGIVFSVRPPKKSWKNIANLSGGEKTLSSLALVFALHHYKPTPLYVMDEIDAALDFKNVSIVAHYLKERTKDAQFVIISLRNNMFELADRLVGIYKTDNCTKSITINPGSFAIAQG